PIDLVVDGSIGPHSHEVPALRMGTNLALDRHQMREYAAGVLGKRIVLQLMGEIGDRATLVAVGETEKIDNARAESFDAQGSVEEKGTEIGSSHQILQIIMRPRDALKLELELVIDGPKLLIDRPQLLIGSA